LRGATGWEIAIRRQGRVDIRLLGQAKRFECGSGSNHGVDR
jgi:hypothetical protein